MFKKVLVANRGEIALRIIRTLKEMHITSVAVYSDIDRTSPFVYHADEAYSLNGNTSEDTYLNQKKILQIAKTSSAEAIHPGYGFLSENADFANLVRAKGLVFIGPSAEAIRKMGNKTEARKLMQANGVPTVPGTEEAIKNKKKARLVAQEVGYPILIKAAAGGGGKGMRLILDESEFDEGIEGAAREAKAAFGDGSIYIEKFVEEPRHIEFQILADKKGSIIHLGERECSIQRRHQKIIEESPSVVLNADLRKKMGEAAINAARACGYENAGTIEFLVDKYKQFYFLEMNTRLQVEHPVTEMVTGLDLVQKQIEIASGQHLDNEESLNNFWGHAIECRIYAENPEQNFAPSPGKIINLKPADGPGIREDSGVVQNNEISLYYDPMISKLIAWGQSRDKAIDRMLRALQEYEISGIYTTIPFLKSVLQHKQFKEGRFTTQFIDQHSRQLFKEDPILAQIASLAATLSLSDQNKRFIEASQNSKQNKCDQWKHIHRKQNMGNR
ncbi:MAG: acetyl-CoA carboxylase biotin carboxylase subunit [Caldithrix sp.]|nr:acetyl-CoA carboxylase biotin carboxylase subunit [Caldithrix sp.]